MSRKAWIAWVAALASAAFAGPAPAQLGAPESRLELGGRTLSLSPLEADLLAQVRRVLRGSGSDQDRALAAARSAVNGADARYVLALYQLEIGQQRRDDALRAEALDVLIASGVVPTERLVGYLGLRGDIAFRARDLAVASAAWTRLAELQPNDPQSLVNLAQVRAAQGDAAGAVDLIRRGIAARGSGAEAAPERWYRQWLSIAYNGGLAEQSAVAANALLDAYPTPENWRYALVAYRQLAAPQAAAEIDLLRLMRAAGALVRPAEYLRMTQLLFHAGLATEARAVLNEGLSRGVVDRAAPPTPEIIAEMDRASARQLEPRRARRRQAAATSSAPPPGATPPGTADILFGEGRYSEAAASYRAALQGGGADSAAMNIRLGMALALAGRRGEAEATFRAAAQGGGAQPFYPQLARFWLSWLARSG
jgi:tetratricopeptide (TPR) repeat protein